MHRFSTDEATETLNAAKSLVFYGSMSEKCAKVLVLSAKSLTVLFLNVRLSHRRGNESPRLQLRGSVHFDSTV